jgi:hypothetical protein
MALAATFDASELAKLNVGGIAPNAKEAQRWYEHARQIGAAEADQRVRRFGVVLVELGAQAIKCPSSHPLLRIQHDVVLSAHEPLLNARYSRPPSGPNGTASRTADFVHWRRSVPVRTFTGDLAVALA